MTTNKDDKITGLLSPPSLTVLIRYLHEEGLTGCLFNWHLNPDWIGSHSSAALLVCQQEVRGKEMGSRVPVIAQQLLSSETWPIKTA